MLLLKLASSVCLVGKLCPSGFLLAVLTIHKEKREVSALEVDDEDSMKRNGHFS